MKNLAKAGLACAVLASALRMDAATPATIRSVSVLGAGSSVEVEVVASSPVQAQTLVVTGPDRLVLDFPNSVPDSKLREIKADKGELTRVRVGRYSSNPPTTRVVLDLKSAQSFQLFPSGKTTIVKLSAAGGSQAQAQLATSPVPVIAPKPRIEVNFANGKLRIWADRATLADVLAEVRRRTGAQLILPPGAGQEPIFADLGPAPAQEVLAALLNGSQFNFVMVGSDRDPSQLRGVYLTMRQGGGSDNSVSYPAVTAGAMRQGAGSGVAESEPPPPEQEPIQPEVAPNLPPPPEQPAPQQ
jgi:hypothetical protein